MMEMSTSMCSPHCFTKVASVLIDACLCLPIMSLVCGYNHRKIHICDVYFSCYKILSNTAEAMPTCHCKAKDKKRFPSDMYPFML